MSRFYIFVILAIRSYKKNVVNRWIVKNINLKSYINYYKCYSIKNCDCTYKSTKLRQNCNRTNSKQKGRILLLGNIQTTQTASTSLNTENDWKLFFPTQADEAAEAGVGLAVAQLRRGRLRSDALRRRNEGNFRGAFPVRALLLAYWEHALELGHPLLFLLLYVRIFRNGEHLASVPRTRWQICFCLRFFFNKMLMFINIPNIKKINIK